MDRKNKTYLLGQYEKSMPNELSLKDKLYLSKQNGFDYLEMSIDESDEKLARLDWDLKTINELKQIMMEEDYYIKSICLSAHRKYSLGSPKYSEQGLEIGYKAIDLAEKLGVRLIQLAGYDVYYEKGDQTTKARFIKNLIKLVKYASTKSVDLGFETMETSFMDTVSKAMEYVDLVNSSYLGIYPDIGNLENAQRVYHHNLIEDLQVGKGHFKAAHLKETLPNQYRDLNFGEGHTNFAVDIDELKQLGVHMFTAEWWCHGDDYINQMQKTNTYLRSILNEIF